MENMFDISNLSDKEVANLKLPRYTGKQDNFAKNILHIFHEAKKLNKNILTGTEVTIAYANLFKNEKPKTHNIIVIKIGTLVRKGLLKRVRGIFDKEKDGTCEKLALYSLPD